MRTTRAGRWRSIPNGGLAATIAAALLAWLVKTLLNRRKPGPRVQPAQPGLACIGAGIAIFAFLGTIYAARTPLPMPVPGMPKEWQAAWTAAGLDLGVQGAVLAGLVAVPGLRLERWVVLGFVVPLVIIDAYRFIDGIDNPILQSWATAVLIVQALSPLWMKLLRWFARNSLDLLATIWNQI